MGAGHKRHLVVDCLASIHLVWADDGYAGRLVDWAAEKCGLTLQIVKRSDDTAGFVVLPRRWVVDRTLSWLMRSRCLVRDYETLPAMHEAVVLWSMTMLRSPGHRRGDLLVLGEGVDGADLLLRRGRLGDLTARAALGLVRRPPRSARRRHEDRRESFLLVGDRREDVVDGEGHLRDLAGYATMGGLGLAPLLVLAAVHATGTDMPGDAAVSRLPSGGPKPLPAGSERACPAMSGARSGWLSSAAGRRDRAGLRPGVRR